MYLGLLEYSTRGFIINFFLSHEYQAKEIRGPEMLSYVRSLGSLMNSLFFLFSSEDENPRILSPTCGCVYHNCDAPSYVM